MFDAINWAKINTPAEWVMIMGLIGVISWAVWAWIKRGRVQNNESLDAKTIKTLTDNNSALEERVKIVESETKQCRNDHSKSQEDIARLQGELRAYKELVLIPADFLKELQRNQVEIIKLLKGNK